MFVIESIKSVNDISNNPKLHGIIIDLKIIIDTYDYNFKKFQELILELAHPVDQSYKIQTYELEGALRKQEQFLGSDQIISEETVFLYPEEKLQLIKESIEKSNKFCYVKFDKNKILREAQSDIAVTE